MAISKKFNKFTGTFDLVRDEAVLHFKDPVDAYANLPIVSNLENDCRFTKDTDDLWVWSIASASGNLTDWKQIPLLSNVDLDDIADGTTYKRITATDQSKIHDQNTDTALGALASDINMNTHQLESLSVPDANGEAIRQTTKITEANLEDAIDKKHSNTYDLSESEYNELHDWLDFVVLESGGAMSLSGDLEIQGSGTLLQIGDGTYSWGHSPMVGIEGTLEVDASVYFDADLTVVSQIISPIYTTSTVAGGNPIIKLYQGTASGAVDNNFYEFRIDGGGTDNFLFRSYYSSSYHTIMRVPIGTVNTEFEGTVKSQVVEDTASIIDEVLNTGITASYGMLIVRESVEGITGVYRIENETIIAISQNTGFTITKDNAGTINCYWETDSFKIQNKRASSGDEDNIRVGFFGV